VALNKEENLKEIIFDGVSKSYDKETTVLDNLNFKINEGERLVLLGPSGCGKSTTLRIIAGLSSITSGKLILGGEVANDLEPKDRNISMVFQNYALYPHMSVRENICYALKINKVPQDEIEKRLKDVLTTLKLEGLEDRKPKDLSGGQRQRVALARALVKQSDYFLLDEPLSNLDAQLRLHARKELVKLHEKYKMTLVYVTHDQVEAMTIGERIVLLNKGKIQMADSPNNIYNHPRNVFTATFIGSPSMNIIKSKVLDGKVYIGDHQVMLPENLQKLISEYEKGNVYLGIRPEYIDVAHEDKDNIEINVNFVEDYGNKLGVYFDLEGSEHVLLSDDKNIKNGDKLFIKFDREKICLFDIDTEENLEVLN
jgi:ABC-type sugar transport system ATPase subunit